MLMMIIQFFLTFFTNPYFNQCTFLLAPLFIIERNFKTAQFVQTFFHKFFAVFISAGELTGSIDNFFFSPPAKSVHFI